VAISRREFLAGAAGAGIGFGLGAFSHQLPLPPPHVGPDWRAGLETFVPSTCLLCPAHCGIRARLVDGDFSRIDGNPLHPVSQGGLCPKGRAGIQLLYHPGRLKGPVQRVGPPGSEAFEPISWDEALDRLVGALRSAREQGEASSVQWLLGDTSGVMGDLIEAFCRAYGTKRITVDDYRDGSADAMRMCQGIEAPPAYDLDQSDLIVSFGAALSEAWWALPLAARARDNDPARAPRWVQIDVRLSRTAVSADEFFPVRPGTYGTLALGLAYLMAKEGLYDVNAVSGRVSGWEDWTDDAGNTHVGFRTLVLRHGRPDDVSSHTGVPVARLVALAKAFGQALRPVAVWDQAVSWRTGGLADVMAIHALNILVGSLNRPGGVLAQAPMALPGPLEGISSGDRMLSRARLTATSLQTRDGQTPAPRILFLYQSNPLSSAPREEEVRQALSAVPLVVSFSPFFDESARHANLILPDHTYLERWQDALAPAAVPYPVWGVVQPVIKPLHDTRATGDVVLDLAARLGGEVNVWSRWSSVEAMVRERAAALAGAHRGSAFVRGFRQGELRELESRGWWLPHSQPADEYGTTILESGGWFDPVLDYHDRSGVSQHRDGRVWIFPAEARQRLQEATLGLAEGFLPIGVGPVSDETGQQVFPLRLTPFRVMTLSSGGTVLMPWLLEHLGVLTDNAWETWVEIHPETARRLGLEAGQRVRVESSEGAFDATVRVFSGSQPGVVNVPYGLHTRVEGWGEPRGANPLKAVGARVDPVTGLPDWYSTDVRLIPI
jgi:anaerobic selenocysteine-containing dehydrogenase